MSLGQPQASSGQPEEPNKKKKNTSKVTPNRNLKEKGIGSDELRTKRQKQATPLSKESTTSKAGKLRHPSARRYIKRYLSNRKITQASVL